MNPVSTADFVMASIRYFGGAVRRDLWDFAKHPIDRLTGPVRTMFYLVRGRIPMLHGWEIWACRRELRYARAFYQEIGILAEAEEPIFSAAADGTLAWMVAHAGQKMTIKEYVDGVTACVDRAMDALDESRIN